MKKDLKVHLDNVLDWILHFISYAIVLVFVATFFESFQIDDTHLYTYGIIATFIIFILNKTVKPIVFRLTLPLTGMTLGLFYPFVNVSAPEEQLCRKLPIVGCLIQAKVPHEG